MLDVFGDVLGSPLTSLPLLPLPSTLLGLLLLLLPLLRSLDALCAWAARAAFLEGKQGVCGHNEGDGALVRNLA